MLCDCIQKSSWKDNSIKRKKVGIEGVEKNANCKRTNDISVSMLHVAFFMIPTWNSICTFWRCRCPWHTRNMCGSHVAANRIRECVCGCVCVNKGAETNAFSWNFIHKDFILLFRTQRSKPCKGVQRKGRRQKRTDWRAEGRTDSLARSGQHENKDLLPLNMDSPRPWHVQEVCRNCR